jgi:hypothetical protein
LEKPSCSHQSNWWFVIGQPIDNDKRLYSTKPRQPVEIQGYTTDEAGVDLQATGSAVRGLLKRGRAKLLARLGGPVNE